MFGRIQQGPIWAQSCFGRLLIIDSMSLTDTDLLRLSVSSCVRLADCTSQGVGPLHLGHRVCEHGVAHNAPLSLFYVHGVCSDVPAFTCDISSLCSLFILSWSGQRLINFIDLFEIPVFGFIYFVY